MGIYNNINTIKCKSKNVFDIRRREGIYLYVYVYLWR